MRNALTLHGANPEYLYSAFGLTMPDKIIDFSTNTNVLPCPYVDVDVAELASRYPDNDCSRLKHIVAQHENISPSRILFTNGSNEAIFLLASLLRHDTAILQPAYSEYSRAFKRLHSVFNLTDALRFKNIIVINPSNPTGIYTPLRDVIASCTRNTFIVDEAYRDFLLTAKPEKLCDLQNVVLVRSLTKIFHLSGARIGYVIAPENVITALREHQPTWSVNAFAQALTLHFMMDEGFVERTRGVYRECTPAFVEGVKGAGFETVKSDVHYFLVKVEDDLRVIGELLKKGVVVRHTRNFEGLDGKYIRVATRTHEDNNILVKALELL